MEKTILISPFSKKLRNGENNPKNYPYWQDVIHGLISRGFKVVQLGTGDESKFIECSEIIWDSSLKNISTAIRNCYTWISVDNFLPHLANLEDKKGIVIFGVSDPNIFGYKQNINILKDRSYLRENQFLTWDQQKYNSDVFMDPRDVLNIFDSNF